MDNNRKRTVLVVDDEPLVLESLAEFIQDLGYDTRAASSEKEALGLIETSPVDAVISDLVLGSDSGLSLFQKIRKTRVELSNPCCILMTGFGTLGSAIEAMRLGVHDYLMKPIDLRELEKALSIGLERRETVGNSIPAESPVELVGRLAGPLNWMRAYQTMFLEERFGSLTPLQRQKVQAMERCLDEATVALRHFQEGSPVPSQKAENLDLGALIERTLLRHLKDFERRGVSVNLALPDKYPMLEIDAQSVQSAIIRVVAACLLNAREGARLDVEWKKVAKGWELWLWLSKVSSPGGEIDGLQENIETDSPQIRVNSNPKQGFWTVILTVK